MKELVAGSSSKPPEEPKGGYVKVEKPADGEWYRNMYSKK